MITTKVLSIKHHHFHLVSVSDYDQNVYANRRQERIFRSNLVKDKASYRKMHYLLLVPY